MAVKPTLLVLAAGMATRYGSLKQLDQFGPNGETIIDYSLYDAIRAGFGKVVFVIRQSIEKEFKAVMPGTRQPGEALGNRPRGVGSAGKNPGALCRYQRRRFLWGCFL